MALYRESVASMRFEDYLILWKPDQHYVEFEVLSIAGHDSDNAVMYDKRTDPYNWTSSISEADLFLRGSIKWDGCSNFEFGNNSIIHFCGIQDVRGFSSMLEKLYAIAKSCMPTCEECG